MLKDSQSNAQGDTKAVFFSREELLKLAEDLATWDDGLTGQVIYFEDLKEALHGHKATATGSNRDCE